MAMLEIAELDAYYGRAHILQSLGFTMERGEVLALMGRNGAGKSTTMKAVMGLVPPAAGRIAFDLPRAQVTPQMIAELYQGEPSTPAPAPAALPEADAMLVKPGAGACL